MCDDLITMIFKSSCMILHLYSLQIHSVEKATYSGIVNTKCMIELAGHKLFSLEKFSGKAHAGQFYTGSRFQYSRPLDDQDHLPRQIYHMIKIVLS